MSVWGGGSNLIGQKMSPRLSSEEIAGLAVEAGIAAMALPHWGLPEKQNSGLE